MFWCYLVAQFFSRKKYIISRLPLKRNSSYSYKLIYGCLLLLSATDLTLLKMLPWEGTEITTALLGYPGPILAQACANSGLLMSALQFSASAYGLYKGATFVGVTTGTIGLLCIASSISLISSTYNAVKIYSVKNRIVQSALLADVFNDAVKSNTDELLISKPINEVPLSWSDIVVLDERHKQSMRLSSRLREIPQTEVATDRVCFGWLKTSNVPIAIKVFRAQADSTADTADEVNARARLEYTRERLANQMTVYALLRGPVVDPELARLLRTQGDAIAIIKEYIPGGTLDERLLLSPLMMDEKLEILIGIAACLSDLHQAGVVHGELQPSHILIGASRPYKIRLINFSKAVTRSTRSSNNLPDRGISRLSSHTSIEVSDDDNGRIQEELVLLPQPSPYVAPELLSAKRRVRAASSPRQRSNSVAITTTSRKTDVFSLAVISWQVLAYPSPLPNFSIDDVFDGKRPPLTALPATTPQPVQSMICRGWSFDRKERPDGASECFVLLKQALSNLQQQHFDVFCSHQWNHHKGFVRRVSRSLQSMGYRVWFDELDMGHKIQQSMDEGVQKSKVFLACINRDYHGRKNCMHELRTAHSLGKPIITIVLDSDLFTWPGSEEVRELCRCDCQSYIKVSELAANPGWTTDSDSDSVTPDMHKKLHSVVQTIARFLEESNCWPSLHVSERSETFQVHSDLRESAEFGLTVYEQ